VPNTPGASRAGCERDEHRPHGAYPQRGMRMRSRIDYAIAPLTPSWFEVDHTSLRWNVRSTTEVPR